MITALRRRRARRDEGLTLVELLISMTLIGVIATTVAAVITVAMRNNPAVELRTDSAHSLQGVVTWLPQDIDSTPPTGFDMSPTAATGCATNDGVNLLRLEWTEFSGGVVTHYVSSYRYVNQGTKGYIYRITCNGTAAPYGGSTRQKVSSELQPLPADWSPGELPASFGITYDESSGDVDLVTVRVMTFDNIMLTVQAAPKNPANTLPPTTLAGTPASVTTVLATTTTVAPPTTTPSGTTTTVFGATTTTSTTTTTLAATTTTLAPCVVTGASMSATSIKNTDPNGNGNSSTNVGVLATALTINVTTTGYCTGLEARAVTGAPNSELFRNFTPQGGGAYRVIFPGWPQGSSELWADGARQIAFYSPTGGPYGSVTLTVK